VKLERETTESIWEVKEEVYDRARLDKEMRVKANVSDFAIEGVLSMKYKNEK